jgi:hypothetical protein
VSEILDSSLTTLNNNTAISNRWLMKDMTMTNAPRCLIIPKASYVAQNLGIKDTTLDFTVI